MPDMDGKYNELIVPDDEAIYSQWYKYQVVGGRLELIPPPPPIGGV
jgi:hypothetical protein